MAAEQELLELEEELEQEVVVVGVVEVERLGGNLLDLCHWVRVLRAGQILPSECPQSAWQAESPPKPA